MNLRSFISSVAASAMLATGLVAVATGPAEAAAHCATSKNWESKNISCKKKIRHYNKVNPPGPWNTKTYYASWVRKGRISKANMCYAHQVASGHQHRK